MPLNHLETWIGRQEVRRDICDANRFVRLAATLDHEAPPWHAGLLPPLGHWLCFLPHERQSLLGADGHPLRTGDGVLPDVDLPRRMWAGSRIRFLHDVALDSRLIRTSTLIAATPKEGRSGTMLFATLRHEIAGETGAVAIVEDQDIVYREAPAPGAPPLRTAEPAVEPGGATRSLTADAALLLRYSALTFNAHRIHYDRDYARDVEGYPDLVVHGPLVATLLLDHLLRDRPDARIATYEFRALSPLFVGEEMTLALARQGGDVALSAVGPTGVVMRATVGLAQK